MRVFSSWILCTASFLCLLFTGCGGGSLPRTSVPPAVPLTLTGISPSTVPAGSAAVTLTVTGTGFDASTTLRINGAPITVTLVSATTLTATVPASLLASGGQLSLILTNAGGSTSDTGATSTLEVDNPAPGISAANPASLPLNAGTPTLSLTGTGFVPATSAQVNGSSRPTTVANGTALSVVLAAADTASASPLAITLFNPTPGGGTSAALTVPVLNPAPGNLTLSPASVPSGATTLSAISVTGTNFVAGATARVNGAARPTNVLSGTQLSFQLTNADQAIAGTLSIDVLNPAPGGGASPALPLPVTDPLPTIAILAPGSLLAGSTPATLTITGTNFVAGSTAEVNGAARPTTVLSASQLSLQLSAADLATAGTISITVSNPAPGGGSSNPAKLAVNNPSPGQLLLTPATVPVGGTTTLPINVMGPNLLSSSSLQVNGTPRTSAFVNASQLTFQLTPADQASASTLSITITNPTPGGGTSPAATLTISNPAPGTISLNPASVPGKGSAALTITVTGSNFVPGSVVQLNGTPRSTTFVNAGQLTFQLTPEDQATGGTITVSVTTPGPGGGASTAASLTVLQTPLTLTSLAPSSLYLGSADQLVTIAGSNFTSSCVGLLNGQPMVTTVVSAQSLQVTVPASALATVGTLTFSARDSATSVVSTNSLPLTVINPVPVLTQFTPQAIAVNSASTTVTFTGSNFNHNTVVLLGMTALPTTFGSSSQITATLPATALTSIGQISLTISNPAPQGGTAIAALSVVEAPPVLTSLSPASVLVNTSATTITLTGQGFTPYSQVTTPGYYLATTYVSPTTLTFTFPLYTHLLTGSYTISVAEPQSGPLASNSLNFQVVNPTPVITSLSPAVVTAGAESFLLTVNGSGFQTVGGGLSSVSQVFLNGVPQPYFSGNDTSISVPITPAQVATPGDVTVTVVNAGPGGGSSNTKTLKVVTSDTRVRTVNASAFALGWDAAHSLLLATTSSASAQNPNSLIAIDPVQGTIVAAQTLASQPQLLSVADDDSYAYVSLPDTGQIERLRLPSLQPDITFSLGAAASNTPWPAKALLAAPGHPHTVAVSRASLGTPGGTEAIVIFDDGIPRPNVASPTEFDGSFDALVWGADSTSLYASNRTISTGEEDVFNVNSQGVTLTSSNNGVLSTFIQLMAFDPATNRLIDDFGGITNAVTEASAGKLVDVYPLPYEPSPNFALDTAQRKAFFVSPESLTTYSSDLEIRAYDIDQYKYLDEVIVPGLTNILSLTRWGASGLAASSDSQIFLIDGAFVSPNSTGSPTGSYLSTSPTLSSVTPASAPAGSPDVQLTLTGKEFSFATTVTWNNTTLPLDSVTATRLTVTVPAALMTTPIAGPLTVTNGPGTQAAPPLAFSVLPDLGASAQLTMLDLSGEDAAWDATRNLLYVAVPAIDPVFPNSIAVVDPTTTTLRRTIPVLDQLGPISLTSDASYLYAGFSANPVVQRYALPDFSLDLTIPLGSPAIPYGTPVGGRQTCTFAVAVQAAPGNPHTVAIDQGNSGIEPRGCGALTIYDDAVQRPSALPDAAGGDETTIAWGLDATTLFGQSDSCCTGQSQSQLFVSTNGVSLGKGLRSGDFGYRIHFDASTGYLLGDSGAVTNPANATAVTSFAPDPNIGYAVLAFPDAASHRIYVLSHLEGSASPDTANFQLDIYDSLTFAKRNTLSLPNLLGNPTQLLRWGTSGVAITTLSSDGLGALYLVQGAAVTPP